MPQVNSGIYELILEQDYFGADILNVFHYRQTGGVDDEQEKCANAFDVDIMPEIAVILNDDLKFNNIRVANLTGNLADFSITPSQVDGDVTGAVMADFIACSYRLNRTTKDTRNGSKRFCGMVEENIVGGGFTAAYVADLDLLADVLETTIAGGTGAIFEPIILRKPDIAGTFTYSLVQTVQALNRVTTQNSRKKF